MAIVVGGLLVLIGSMLATWGWNERSERKQKSNLVIGLARELGLNGTMIAEASDLARRWNRRSEREGFSYQTYSEVNALAILSSGRLDPRDKKEKELLGIAEEYRSAVADVNASLRIAGRQNPGTFVKIEWISAHPKQDLPVEDERLFADVFLRLIRSHDKLKEYLKKEYPQSL